MSHMLQAVTCKTMLYGAEYSFPMITFLDHQCSDYSNLPPTNHWLLLNYTSTHWFGSPVGQNNLHTKEHRIALITEPQQARF
jgi:hypothetical protein